VTPAATADAREALKRAQDAVALAVPATPREHVAEVVAVTLWLAAWAEELGPAALDDLARRLEPIRKDHLREERG
jgi:hypothetical protein